MQSSEPCPFPTCNRPVRTAGLCNGHYEQRRKGRELTSLDPRVRESMTLSERLAFHSDLDATTGCRVWRGGGSTDRYPSLTYKGVCDTAHAFSYRLAHGPVPLGMIVDHKCRNRRCVNPGHLQAVTPKENNENVAATGSNKSGHRGVYKHRASGLWQVQVTHNYKKHSGGYFHEVEEAAEAARALRNRLFTNNLTDRAGA